MRYLDIGYGYTHKKYERLEFYGIRPLFAAGVRKKYTDQVHDALLENVAHIVREDLRLIPKRGK